MNSVLLQEIRKRTQQTHAGLDHSPLLGRITSSAVTHDDYMQYLAKTAVMHSAVEEQVFPVLHPLLPDTQQRKKAALALNDLAHYNAPAPATAFRFFDDEFSAIVPFCLGVMYVAEGSMLGGQHIMRNLQAQLDKDGSGSFRFFRAYGEQAGTLWKNFMSALAAFETTASESEKAEVIKGAEYGFARAEALYSSAH